MVPVKECYLVTHLVNRMGRPADSPMEDVVTLYSGTARMTVELMEIRWSWLWELRLVKSLDSLRAYQPVFGMTTQMVLCLADYSVELIVCLSVQH